MRASIVRSIVVAALAVLVLASTASAAMLADSGTLSTRIWQGGGQGYLQDKAQQIFEGHTHILQFAGV